MSCDGRVSGNFIHPCLRCGTTVRVVGTVEQSHDCDSVRLAEGYESISYAWWAGYDARSRGLRIGVTGGREFNDWNLVAATVHALPPAILVHGGASGADDLCAKWWTRMMGRQAEAHYADWERECDEHCTHRPSPGRCPAAGPIRNQQMVDSGLDLLVAFPGGRGTADMVRRAEAAGIPVMHAGAARRAAADEEATQ